MVSDLIVWILAGIIAVALITLLRTFQGRTREAEEYVYDEPEPFIDRRATVLHKDVDMVHKRKYGFEALYEVTFSFADGESETFSVPEPLYDRFAAGMTAKLVTQNGRFIGFGSINIGELDSDEVDMDAFLEDLEEMGFAPEPVDADSDT